MKAKRGAAKIESSNPKSSCKILEENASFRNMLKNYLPKWQEVVRKSISPSLLEEAYYTCRSIEDFQKELTEGSYFRGKALIADHRLCVVQKDDRCQRAIIFLEEKLVSLDFDLRLLLNKELSDSDLNESFFVMNQSSAA